MRSHASLLQALSKSQVIQGILQVLLNIMATPHGENDEYDDMLGEEELGTESPGSYAAQVSCIRYSIQILKFTNLLMA